MQTHTALKWLVPVIGVLALLAASAGLFWPAQGQPFAFTTHRGEEVMIAGRGLYRYDTVSAAAQEQAADFVTLVVGLPLLAVSAWLAWRGSLRGQLLLTGTLGYFLYTYMQMSVNTSYNPLFLVYVALFSLSLFAFVLSMLGYDLAALPSRFSDRLPRRAIAGVLFAAGGFLLLAWVGGRILPTLGAETVALENMTTMVIQAMDLGLIVPLAILAGVLLLRRSSWGYLLASVAVMKMLTLGTSVSAMAINMALTGVAGTSTELVIFLSLTFVNAVVAWQLLASVRPAAAGTSPAPRRAATANLSN
jgi:hypothetical protein